MMKSLEIHYTMPLQPDTLSKGLDWGGHLATTCHIAGWKRRRRPKLSLGRVVMPTSTCGESQSNERERSSRPRADAESAPGTWSMHHGLTLSAAARASEGPRDWLRLNGPTVRALNAESPKRTFKLFFKKWFGHENVFLTDFHYILYALNCDHFRWFPHTPMPPGLSKWPKN